MGVAATMFLRGAACLLPLLTIPTVHAQTSTTATKSLRSSSSRAGSFTVTAPAVSPLRELRAKSSLTFTKADGTQRGELWLLVSAQAAGSRNQLTLRVPLSSTEDAYGESRSCKRRPGGGYGLTFTAGLDERNFLAFSRSTSPQAIDLLLNKYLCRALAAPFQCGATQVALPSEWNAWKLAATTELRLTTAAPAILEFLPMELGLSTKPFAPETCSVIAPSSGLCCVGGRETRWHCGGKPAGTGWHQVSGECFHHETGNSCTDH